MELKALEEEEEHLLEQQTNEMVEVEEMGM